MSRKTDAKSVSTINLPGFGCTPKSNSQNSRVRRSPKGGDKSNIPSITGSSTKADTRKSKTAQSDNREIWAADSETDPFRAGRLKIAPFIWGAFNGTQYWEFRTTREFVDFIKERECIVYAHNGGKFDWFFLLDELMPWQPLMVINGRLAKFTIGKAEFRDSFNIMPMSLATVQKTEIDYDKFEADVREQHMPEIREYLRDDCVYLHGMLTAFIAEFGLHLTQAGASVKAWERIADVKAPNTSKEFYDELAPYYYGGRVQCFYSGEYKDRFKIVDINSAYPFAMMSEHPSGDTITSLTRLPATDAEISRTFITLIAASYGALPCRAGDKSLSFPADGLPRTFHITGWEYLAARDTGALADVQILGVKTLNETIEFSAYLDHFYAMKTDSKRAGFADGKWHDMAQKARYEFSKRFLNSLYGKMGANPEHYEEFTVVKPHHIDAAEQEDGFGFVCELGNLALVSKPLPEDRHRYYNVAIAASVTGFVRAYLWRAIVECRSTGGTVLYCDTDCLWATETGGLRLHPEDLGAWDVEAECDYGAIAGKKLYAAQTLKTGADGERVWKIASKGVRLEREQIVRVAQGEKIRYEPENPTFSLKRGISFTPRTIRRSATADTEGLENGIEADPEQE